MPYSAISNKFDHHIHRLLVLALYLIGVCLGALFITVCWHMGAPQKLHYLSEAKIDALCYFLFSGGIGVIVGRFASRT